MSTTATQNSVAYIPNTGLRNTYSCGIRFKPGKGVNFRIIGAKIRAAKYGSPPGNFVADLYTGNTQVASSTFPVANMLNATEQFALYFDTPTWVNSSTWTYIIGRESGGLGNSANYWFYYITTLPAAYLPYILPSDTRLVYGTSTTPNDYTVSPIAVPLYFMPIIDNWQTDISPPPRSYAY